MTSSEGEEHTIEQRISEVRVNFSQIYKKFDESIGFIEAQHGTGQTLSTEGLIMILQEIRLLYQKLEEVMIQILNHEAELLQLKQIVYAKDVVDKDKRQLV